MELIDRAPHRATRARRLTVAGAAAVAALSLLPLAASAATGSARAHAHVPGIKISTVPGPFGDQLVVGSGPYAWFSVYALTSDTKTSFACTTRRIRSGRKVFSCTGPINSTSAEWPALTTSAAPVAGAGVQQSMLGTVWRPGIGHQVTYDGHPLYGYSGDTVRSEIAGEGFFEPGYPPFHGQWWLVNPDGNFQPWAETLTSMVTSRHVRVLGALLPSETGWFTFPLYAYSQDTPSSSACTGACAQLFPPLLTDGTAGVSGNPLPGVLTTITRPDGTTQLAYDGHPLYLYSTEAINKYGLAGADAVGSGNNRAYGGGTFSLVTP